MGAQLLIERLDPVKHLTEIPSELVSKNG